MISWRSLFSSTNCCQLYSTNAGDYFIFLLHDVISVGIFTSWKSVKKYNAAYFYWPCYLTPDHEALLVLDYLQSDEQVVNIDFDLLHQSFLKLPIWEKSKYTFTILESHDDNDKRVMLFGDCWKVDRSNVNPITEEHEFEDCRKIFRNHLSKLPLGMEDVGAICELKENIFTKNESQVTKAVVKKSELSKYLKYVNKIPLIFKTAELSSKDILRIRKKFGIPENAHIYAIHDASESKNNSIGIVFSSDGVYWNNSANVHIPPDGYENNKRGLISWKLFFTTELSLFKTYGTGEGSILFNGIGLIYVSNAVKMIDLLLEIQNECEQTTLVHH